MKERIRLEREIEILGMPREEQEILLPDRTEQVDRFMRREKDFQQWRVLALLKCGALELIRGGVRTPLTRETEKLKSGDQIDLQSPLSAPCQKAVDNIPETDYSDYAFANPKPADDYEKYVIKYLELHPQISVLSSGAVDSLTSFIRSIKKDDRVIRPIRHLIFASHASRTGRLALHLTTGPAPKLIEFEDLEAAIISKVLVIDPQLLQPRPKDATGQIIPAQVHIKGCNIGNPIAAPFLQLLKKALGGNMGVTAPRFFHAMKTIFDVKKRGRTVISRKLIEIWEYFSYEFVLYRTTKLTSKTNAVAAFVAAVAVDPTLKLIDGSSVPQTDWDRWIPRVLPRENKVASVNVPVNSALSSRARNVDGEFRYRKTFFLRTEWQTISLPGDPGTDALRKDEIKKRLVAGDKRYEATHPFPMYTRTGFKTLDEFFDSYNWRFKPFDTTRNELSFSGTRHEYTVLAPIVAPGTNDLFMNLFPVAGPPTINLTETDTRFFGSV